MKFLNNMAACAETMSNHRLEHTEMHRGSDDRGLYIVVHRAVLLYLHRGPKSYYLWVQVLASCSNTTEKPCFPRHSFKKDSAALRCVKFADTLALKASAIFSFMAIGALA